MLDRTFHGPDAIPLSSVLLPSGALSLFALFRVACSLIKSVRASVPTGSDVRHLGGHIVGECSFHVTCY